MVEVSWDGLQHTHNLKNDSWYVTWNDDELWPVLYISLCHTVLSMLFFFNLPLYIVCHFHLTFEWVFFVCVWFFFFNDLCL